MRQDKGTLTKLLKFYGLLACVYISDIVVLVGLIWNTYKITASPWFLGFILSISIIIPYLLRRIFPKANLLHLNMKQLFIFRIVIYAVILLLSATQFVESYLGITVTIILYGTLNLTTLTAFEARNTQWVINKSITSGNSSRVMQTVMQTGAFLGSLLSGLLSSKHPLSTTLIYISIFDIVLSLMALIFMRGMHSIDTAMPLSSHPGIKKHSAYKASPPQVKLFLINGLIGLHIAAFNVLTPIFFQSLNHWNSQQFGVAAGVSGAGAFIAALLKHEKFPFLFCSILLVVADAVFSFTQIGPISLAACFFIGLSLNLIRIGTRVKIIDTVKDNNYAHSVASQSATYFSAFQATGPLVMGILLTDTLFGVDASRWLLPLAALLIFAATVIQSRVLSKKIPNQDA